MKRRVRTQPTNPYYSNEPAVSVGQIADKALVQNASLGNKTSKEVDKHPGRLSGLAGFASKSRPPTKGMAIQPPKFGSSAKEPAKVSVPKATAPKSPLRMSGVKGAHRVGFKKI